MTATRSRKEERHYKRYLRNNPDSDCAFCKINKKEHQQFVEETASFKVIRNIFKYSIWDGQQVVDHLMVVPKRHTDSLANLSDKQAAELVKIIGKYEKRGFNVYARAPTSPIKSIVHQHSHLIKTAGASKRFIFLLRRPYIRIVL